MILIVEDEPSLASVVADYLSHSGYQTHIIGDGAEVIDWVRRYNPDLILLDLMLPNRDGLDIYRELRSFSDIPIIMATAKVDEIDRLLGLELGADDYVCKPYSPRELVARVKNVLRRFQHPPSHTARSPLKVDPDKMQTLVDDTPVMLTPAEFQLLCYFNQHHGQVFSRDQLMNRIYSDGRVVTDRTIDSHIKNLRKKVQAVNDQYDWIKSVYGVGYRFELD
ncbi:response regulator [Vibrio brasiliensis]|jgi:two-component system response regulator BaeR|uniref:response regulator n=1 Tax=Vibrio brasiliensis TaxID=170652 RepID=UPI001EFD0FD7|nr:response regulator [Vibrio brasiliensis]MCG9782484.1 response regulator [Vibrio brasiliensis]